MKVSINNTFLAERTVPLFPLAWLLKFERFPREFDTEAPSSPVTPYLYEQHEGFNS